MPSGDGWKFNAKLFLVSIPAWMFLVVAGVAFILLTVVSVPIQLLLIPFSRATQWWNDVTWAAIRPVMVTLARGMRHILHDLGEDL